MIGRVDESDGRDSRFVLESMLGYHFTEPSLLQQALTHRSFSAQHNERLEFLGDAALNAVISKLIYDRYPTMPEGDLSRLRSNLVNQSALAQIADELGLGNHLRLGEGELRTGGASRPSTLADAVESLIGAVYIDGGYQATDAVVAQLYGDRIDCSAAHSAAKDAKTRLQEWLQGKHLALPRYHVAAIEGAAHQQVFHVECLIKTHKHSVTTRGKGVTRRAAEQSAAEAALSQLSPS